MQFQVNDGDQYRQVLTVEIPAEEMEPAIRIACKHLSEKVNIPGFRKGKVPRAILENFLGMEAILEEAANDLMPQAWGRAIDELNLEPVDRPAVEITQMGKDQPLIFTANFTKRPEVTLGQYKGLALTRRILELDDSDVEKELQAQRERMSQLIDVEGDEAAQLGDTVTIDFKGTKEDIPFDGGTAENYPLELGSGSFIPGFEEQIVGMKKDEDKAIAVAFPTEYHQKDLAGQPVVFQVHVHEIKRKQLPQLNDEFAQEASETANTLEQFKAELKTGLNEQNHNAADEDCKNSGVKIAVENAQADIPPIMIEQRLDDIIEDMNQRMDAQGLKMEQFFAYTGSNMGQLRENYRAQAELGVKTDLVLESMIKLENFTVTDEEIAAEVKELSTKYWQPEDKVREALEQSGQMEMVKQGIKVRKAVELIFDSAVISDEVVTHAQVEAERQDRAAQAAKTAAEAEAQIQMAQAAKAEIINTETEEDGPLIDAE